MMTNQQMYAYKENIVKEKKMIKMWDAEGEKRMRKLQASLGGQPPPPETFEEEPYQMAPWEEAGGLGGPTWAEEEVKVDPRRQVDLNATGYEPCTGWQAGATTIPAAKYSDSYK
mmetsp:Transcript_3647/g.6918  ORF Transcript_3647/g.6918 Transcript_3647/m.6918 type:complete len:114 (+) Transcript_3647:68-409(+)